MTRSGDRIAIIGAGLSGLTAARRLADSGRRVEIFEKARLRRTCTPVGRIPIVNYVLSD